MKLTSSTTKLSELKEDVWYFIKGGFGQSSEFTGVKIKSNWIYIKFIGGEFEKQFTMTFEYSQRSLNAIWQYNSQEDYDHPIDMDIGTLEWVNDIADIPFAICMDLGYSNKYVIEISDPTTKLADLSEGKWYLVEASTSIINGVTGIKREGNWIFVKYIGGVLEKHFKNKFEYPLQSLNGLTHYYFQDKYEHMLINTDGLNWAKDIATIFFAMCKDDNFNQKHTFVLET
ncbi:hypothetical protein O0Q50_19280 [Priestia aryabhattai]|uniref:Uncharacterized protein n=1 Tax=Priestia aryabhattai TaxID=412384 RepID=A0AAX6NC00_PRIAR|nr:hypothetical protein [Priestia aryabhattai]MDU9693317.1 hypothetical protein [Priestia aryabhattai]